VQVVIADEVQGVDASNKPYMVRSGGSLWREVLEDDAPDGLNFLMRSNIQIHGGDKAFSSPRHHHTFQQVRFAFKGNLNVTPGQDLLQGDIAYFPKGAYYGPQTRQKGGVTVGIQYGFHGEHQQGRVWSPLRVPAVENLKARGKFENGLYFEVDPATGETRQHDAVGIVYEEQYRLMYGEDKVLDFPPERYEAPILMHPKAFDYYRSGPGVEVKRLGQFFDQPGPNGDTRISQVRLSDAGVYPLAAERAQVAWTISPGLVIDGRTYPELTCVYSPRGEDGSLSGNDGVEVFVVDFPRRDSGLTISALTLQAQAACVTPDSPW